MNMKRVTFEVAKLIKEAGYPQGVLPQIHKVKSFPMYYNGDLVNDYDYFYDNYITIFEPNLCVACPTYLDVWLWLWQEKEIKIQVGIEYCTLSFPWCGDSCTFINYSPEEAIISAIGFLVDNDLIK